MRILWQDFRYSLRQLRRNPGFACTAIMILGLGIGATTAIFSAVNPILFEPLPYPQAGRIMMIWDIFQGSRSDVTFHTYREVAERNHSFDAVAVMKPWQPTMIGADRPERLDGQYVSASYFRVLGVVIGLGGAIAASQVLVTLLFGVSRLDPVTYVGVIALLGGVSVIACGVPAWRAAQIDPATTLRAE